MKYGDVIPKGTMVLIRTTNGGELTARLIADHRHTYDVCIEGAVIPCYRIKDVTVTPSPTCPKCKNVTALYPDGRLTCVRCEWEEPLTRK